MAAPANWPTDEEVLAYGKRDSAHRSCGSVDTRTPEFAGAHRESLLERRSPHADGLIRQCRLDVVFPMTARRMRRGEM